VRTLLLELPEIPRQDSEVKQITFAARLEQIPRSGKAVRIERFSLGLPKQSLRDHVTTIGHMGELFATSLAVRVDPRLIAEMVTFHDLAEVIMGDAPAFTAPELAGLTHRTKQDKAIAERAANAQIIAVLAEPLRSRFIEVINLLDLGESDEAKFFYMLDKHEPIISIWRYLSLFSDRINIDQFIEAMADFFDNPNVVSTGINEDTHKLAQFLQSKDMARRYYIEGPTVLRELQPSPFKPEQLQALLSLQMHCIE